MSTGALLFVTLLCLIPAGRDAFFHPPTSSHSVCNIQRQNSRSLLICSSNSDEPPKRKVIRQKLPTELPTKSVPVTAKSNSGSTVKSILMGQPIRSVRRVSPMDQLKYTLTDLWSAITNVWVQIKSFFVRLITAVQANLQASRMRMEERLQDARLRLLEWLREDENDHKNNGGSDGVKGPHHEETGTTLTTTDGDAIVEGSYENENDDDGLDSSTAKRIITSSTPISPEIERKELQRKANMEYAQRKLLEIEMLEKDNAFSKEVRENRRKARDTYAERKLQEIEAWERGSRESRESKAITDNSKSTITPTSTSTSTSASAAAFSSTTNTPVVKTILPTDSNNNNNNNIPSTTITSTSASAPSPSLFAGSESSSSSPSPGTDADPASPNRGVTVAAAVSTPSPSSSSSSSLSSSSASNTGE